MHNSDKWRNWLCRHSDEYIKLVEDTETVMTNYAVDIENKTNAWLKKENQ